MALHDTVVIKEDEPMKTNAISMNDPRLQPSPMLFGGQATRHPVVLLRTDTAAHGHASRWASSLAAALNTELVVVRMINERPVRANVLFPQRSMAEGVHNACAALRVMDARVRWQRRFGEGQGEPPALVSLVNEGASRLAQELAALSPRVVVMAAAGTWPGDGVGTLAVATGAPFLVARNAPRGTAVMAASNLRDARLSVLHQAADWAQALGRGLTFLHNVEPADTQLQERGSNARVRRLERLAEHEGADVTFTRAVDPVTGILEAAGRSNADLIVVGASSGGTGWSRRVTPRITALARRSVLVVPTPA